MDGLSLHRIRGLQPLKKVKNWPGSKTPDFG